MRAVQKTIGMLADSDATVLITGETGTGKELVARAIHDHGHRGGKPFIAVNCAAIPTELLESELFGHVRGAFTGAIADRTGAFREAERGTLFLDEIGDMDIAMQAKLLRALQERVVTPVGGKPVPVDVRVIAATHRDLKQRVRDGSFARTFSTGCTWCRSICRRCASGSPTSFRWPSIFLRERRRQAACTRMPRRG